MLYPTILTFAWDERWERKKILEMWLSFYTTGSLCKCDHHIHAEKYLLWFMVYIFQKVSYPTQAQRNTGLINCSQTKFVVIILVLPVFFNSIVPLTDFSSHPFDISSPKTG